jgi:hypothetical protein
VIGSGRDATYFEGTDLSQRARGMFLTVDGNYFADLDVFGDPHRPTGRRTAPRTRPTVGSGSSPTRAH